MFTNIPDMCTPTQKDGFICPFTEGIGTASIIWGAIGPMRMFSTGQLYSGVLFVLVSGGTKGRLTLTMVALTYWFFIGAVCPLIAYVIHLRWPNSFIRYVKSVVLLLSTCPRLTIISFPVIFNGPSSIYFASGLNYVAWAMVGFIFQYHIRRRHFSWWVKYNCTCSRLTQNDRFSFRDAHRPSRVTDVLSAALDTGLACAVVLIFFILQYPKSGTIGLNTVQKWWGNTVFMDTVDGNKLPYKPLPASGMFG